MLWSLPSADAIGVLQSQRDALHKVAPAVAAEVKSVERVGEIRPLLRS